MAIPKEPRQLMINLMYIVLTALLALNVSAEVLNAFKLVSKGMDTSNAAVEGKNSEIMADFSQQVTLDSVKVGKYYADAQKAQTEVDEFASYVDGLIEEIIQASGGYLPGDDGQPTDDIKNKKDYDTPTTIMINKKKGEELKSKIENLRTTLLSLESLDSLDKISLASQLTLNTNFDKEAAKKLGKDSWEKYLFDHVPIIAVQTLLTKIKGDAKSSLGFVLESLFSQISAADYKFDKLKTVALSPSNYIISGQEFKADVFVSAYSSTQRPEVFIGKFKPELKKLLYDGDAIKQSPIGINPLADGYKPLPVDSQGMGKILDKTSGLGPVSKQGVIKVPKPGAVGQYDYFPFEVNYQVAQSSVVVSPTKMNVLYIGVDNPLAISVAGFQADQISASISQGTLSKGAKGEYVGKVTKPGKAMVNVSAKVEGSMKPMGSMEFRVKRVPDPVAKIGGSKGGKMKVSTFKVQQGIIADLENFDFDVRFIVKSFKMSYQKKGSKDLYEATTGSAIFSQQMKNLQKQTGPGDRVYFDDIRVQAPDGTTRALPGIILELF